MSFKPAKNHLALGSSFFDPTEPLDFPEHILRFRNDTWAKRIGLDALTDNQWVEHFGKFQAFEGSLEIPIALRYHGHQFQHYNPQLGDGRGFLFAQAYDLQDNRLLDLGTKGTGPTLYSRGGDGRLTLKGGVREILATEMLEALGAPTSKSFSLIETGENLLRGDEPSPTRSSVLVRLNHSHIRIGTFQRLSYENDTASLQKLVQYCLENYYANITVTEHDDPSALLLAAITQNVARMGAWLTVSGFVHGVLNTDNINITGELFDFGPWRFLPTYDLKFTAAYFDETSLYAFGRQPETLAWNLTRLAECLLPLSSSEALEPALNLFWPTFQYELSQTLLKRLGLTPTTPEQDTEFSNAFFRFMSAERPHYEQVYFDWFCGLLSQSRAQNSPQFELYASESFKPVLALLADYTAISESALSHSYFSALSPQTMLVDDVETIWSHIATDDNWAPFHDKISQIRNMGTAYAKAFTA